MVIIIFIHSSQNPGGLMRITQWGEYGIHSSIIIASSSNDTGSPVGAEYISKKLGIDLQYTQQILQRLRRNDIIKSVRGPHGGYHLSRQASDISLLDIINAAEGTTFDVICDSKPLTLEQCSNCNGCQLRDIWHGLRQTINNYFLKYTLADLAESSEQAGKIIPLSRAS